MADDTLLTLTAEIVAAHVANNKVGVGDLAALVSATYQALSGLGQPAPAEPPQFPPATTVRKSLADPNRIVSMIDGKPYSSLTRHLRTHGLTPVEYRQRYGLKPDYPMVAPGYAAARRDISLSFGLGRNKPAATAESTSAPAAAPEPPPAPEPKRRGRPKLKLSHADAPAKARRGKGDQQAQDGGAAPATDEQQDG